MVVAGTEAFTREADMRKYQSIYGHKRRTRRAENKEATGAPVGHWASARVVLRTIHRQSVLSPRMLSGMLWESAGFQRSPGRARLVFRAGSD